MKTTAQLIDQIVDTIFPNIYEQIDAQKTQDLLKEFANSFMNKSETQPDVKSFTNSNLDGSYDLTITTPECVSYEITIQKPDGTLMITEGMVEKTSSTQIKVHFGEPIVTGTWYYIIKYYTTTT